MSAGSQEAKREAAIDKAYDMLAQVRARDFSQLDDADLTKEEAVERLNILRQRIDAMRAYADEKFAEAQTAWDALGKGNFEKSAVQAENQALRAVLTMLRDQVFEHNRQMTSLGNCVILDRDGIERALGTK